MPVVFAALVPNSPLLLPGINTEVKKDLSKTLAGYNKLARILKSAKVEIIFNISSLINSDNDYYLYQDKTFVVETKEYGDLLTQYQANGAIWFTHSLKEFIEPQFKIPLHTPERLPIEQAIPLINLNVREGLSCLVIPQFPSASVTINLSKMIADYFNGLQARIAILASGVLARGKSSYFGDNQKILSNIFFKTIKQGEYDNLNNIDMKLRVKVQESLIAPASFIYNLIPSHQAKTSIIALEFTHGINHLLANISW
ncbi:MAG: hypothetical protein WC575_04280 [Patescibacteria group bacterium]